MKPSHDDRIRRRTVLLIDDSVAERDLYEFILKPDFDISTANRGVEGIIIAARDHPDAIVLDVMMPGLDGWETCTEMKCLADTADIPVILLTGTDDRNLRQHASAVGAAAVLQKPCPAERLRDTILTAMAEARITAEN